MLRRFWIHIWLVLAFALVQVGVVSHEISHFEPANQHSQSDQHSQDKHSGDSPCNLCIAYAQIAHGAATHHVFIAAIAACFALASLFFAKLQANIHAPYSARAPPVKTLTI